MKRFVTAGNSKAVTAEGISNNKYHRGNQNVEYREKRGFGNLDK